ncbi:VOC family protein [Micromonospora sp. GCM10011542]|uniref:VOC family protein n=1 Tax=Micromonospora sp. GCM10011542 TaxID=3317337 RepID=UPI003620298E
MNPTTFINLPVRDLLTAAEFYRALGFTTDQQDLGAGTLLLTVNDSTRLMLHVRSAFEAYTGVAVTDTATSREVIVGLAADTRERVDDLVDRAVVAGGEALGPGMETGPLYMRGFRDLDGHQWSFLHLGG